MNITKQQFADLLNGLGSAWISSGAYAGDQPAMAVGSFVKTVADEVRASPTETYEIPPVREEGGAR